MSVLTQPKIDCHHHIFDPVQFPYIPETPYRPEGHELGTALQYGAVMQAYNIRHSLIVGPTSGYNTDNRCLLAALAEHPGRSKGIAVVPLDISSDELATFKEQGVVGIAFNVAMLGTAPFVAVDALMGRLGELDLFAQIQVLDDQLPELMPLLKRTSTPLLIDHSGRPDVDAGLAQPAFKALLSLAGQDRTFVKLSGLSKFSHQPYPWSDAQPYPLALLEAFGAENCMWGSDWPFLRATERMDIGTLLLLVEQMFPDQKVREQILWATPKRVFGFAD
ncbi:amidohydrolase 2 [Pseudomonas sp. M47T1]|uniref:amidohydrolase family protein n=1 Tax=Pseudomonas sp. M47T1 TaxID=1179778 RepID=UPI0002607F56|nr:amidohydrolase family protein [Pseudomonas sp. M47T1]EIK98621.1 amidohydrolase 2 [Pseudomonas sp. M47T1]